MTRCAASEKSEALGCAATSAVKREPELLEATEIGIAGRLEFLHRCDGIRVPFGSRVALVSSRGPLDWCLSGEHCAVCSGRILTEARAKLLVLKIGPLFA